MAGFPLLIPIETPDGDVVTNRPTHDTWRPSMHGVVDDGAEGSAVTWGELLAEDHHKAYGRPWIMGRLYLEQLRGFGLVEGSRLLDVGCGAGRLGVHVIPFLGRGGYAGFDAHLRSLVAFSAYEARLHGLAEKAPRLLLTHDFSLDRLGVDFDFAVDLSVIRNLSADVAARGYRAACAALKPGGRFVTWSLPTIGLDGMAALGMDLEREHTVDYPELAGIVEKPHRRRDHWHVFRRW